MEPCTELVLQVPGPLEVVGVPYGDDEFPLQQTERLCTEKRHPENIANVADRKVAATGVGNVAAAVAGGDEGIVDAAAVAATAKFWSVPVADVVCRP